METHNFGRVPKLGLKHKQREAVLEYLPKNDIDMNLQWKYVCVVTPCQALYHLFLT